MMDILHKVVALYLKGLDLIDNINQAIGSVVLVTPSDAKAGLTANDRKTGSIKYRPYSK
jgi:hypothetical protein